MKKSADKNTSKAVAAKPAKNEPSRKPMAKAADPHDALHSLLRGAYASKVCR